MDSRSQRATGDTHAIRQTLSRRDDAQRNSRDSRWIVFNSILHTLVFSLSLSLSIARSLFHFLISSLSLNLRSGLDYHVYIPNWNGDLPSLRTQCLETQYQHRLKYPGWTGVACNPNLINNLVSLHPTRNLLVNCFVSPKPNVTNTKNQWCDRPNVIKYLKYWARSMKKHRRAPLSSAIFERLDSLSLPLLLFFSPLDRSTLSLPIGAILGLGIVSGIFNNHKRRCYLPKTLDGRGRSGIDLD
jgi:hypothetical protein